MKRSVSLLICLLLFVFSIRPYEAGIVGEMIVGSDKDHPIANPLGDVAGDQVVGQIVKQGEKMISAPTPVRPSVPTPTPTTPSGGSLTPPASASPGVPAGGIAKAGQVIATGGRVLGAGVNAVNTTKNIIDFVNEPSSHQTEMGQRIDVGLKTANICLGVAGTVGAVVVIVTGAPVAAVGGTAFVVVSTTVAIASNVFKGDTGKAIMDLATGRARLGFAPLENNEGLQEGLDIIKDDLGFDLYPGRGHARKVSVEAPNIYLYNEEDIDVRITLEHADWITVSEPVYENGWTAEIRNGSLNGSGDYLFYEAEIPAEWLNSSRGFVIRAASQKEDLEKILAETGFNEKESRDFLEYWLRRLDPDRNYLVCPQETEAIDKIMKLSSDRPIKSYNRYWYYFTELKEGYETAEIVPLVRNGYTLVEWGGILEE